MKLPTDIIEAQQEIMELRNRVELLEARNEELKNNVEEWASIARASTPPEPNANE